MAERRLGVVEFGKEITDKVTFGKELKRHINAGFSVEKIGQWTSLVYYDWLRCSDKDLPFFQVLGSLGLMCSDPCMEWSYEELEELANDLIGEGPIIETQEDFCAELKRRVKARQHMEVIGNWADLVYERLEGSSKDFTFLTVVAALRLLCVPPKKGYARYTYEELDEIADNLLAGKAITL